MKRVRYSSRHVATGLAYLIVTITISIFTTPWLLRWLGPERYGTWRVMSDAFAYLALFDLGFGGAMMALLAPAIGDRDGGTTSLVIASSLRIYRRITLGMLAGGAILVVLLPRLIPNISPDELRFAGILLVLPVLWTSSLVFRALAEARQQGYIVNLLLIAQYLMVTALSLFAAKMNWKLPGQAAANAVGLLLPAIVMVTIGRREYPSFGGSASSELMTTALWKLNWPTLIFNVSGRAGLMSDNIIVGWALGPAMVAPFFLTQRLATLVQSQLQGIGNGTWAGLIELHSQGEHEAFRARLLELTGIVSGLGLAILSPVAAYNRQLVQHWVGVGSYCGDSVTVLACVNVWLASIFSLWGWPISGSGKIAVWVPYSAAFLVINVGVSIACVLRLGVVGPLIGTLIAFLSVNMWAMPMVIERCFGVTARSLLLSAGKPLICGLPYAGVVWAVAHSHSVRGWTALGAELSSAGAVGIALWFYTAISGRERQVWKARLGAMLSNDHTGRGVPSQ